MTPNGQPSGRAPLIVAAIKKPAEAGPAQMKTEKTKYKINKTTSERSLSHLCTPHCRQEQLAGMG
jgi:hypothetical protein